MNTDDFERKLQRQPLRQIPAGWREEILAAATTGHTSRVTRHSFLSALLWPHPAAWAGLAAIWTLIIAVNFSIRDRSPLVAESPCRIAATATDAGGINWLA